MSFKDLSVDMNKQRYIYKCAFLVYAIFFTTEFSQMGSFTLLKAIILIWGLVLLGYDTYENRGKNILKNVMLFIFMVLGLVTILINTNKLGNMKLYLITVIQVFVLAAFDMRNRYTNVKKEIKKVNFTFILVTFALTLISIILYKFKIENGLFILTDPGREELFKGVYSLSNGAGLICYLSAVLSIISLIVMRNRKSFKKVCIFYSINIIIQIFALILTGARASIVAFLFFNVILIFLMIPKKKVRIIIAVVVLLLVATLPMYKPVVVGETNFFNKTTGYDSLSGRRILWNHGKLVVFKYYPVMGPGPGNVVPIMVDATSEFLPGLAGGRLHNIYIDILYSNGILGFAAFMIFMMAAMSTLYKKAFNSEANPKDAMYMKCIFAFLSSILVMNLVESILIYVINPVSIIFWIYMGYSAYLIKKYR